MYAPKYKISKKFKKTQKVKKSEKKRKKTQKKGQKTQKTRKTTKNVEKPQNVKKRRFWPKRLFFHFFSTFCRFLSFFPFFSTFFQFFPVFFKNDQKVQKKFKKLFFFIFKNMYGPKYTKTLKFGKKAFLSDFFFFKKKISAFEGQENSQILHETHFLAPFCELKFSAKWMAQPRLKNKSAL